jgi:hypothetical protein
MKETTGRTRHRCKDDIKLGLIKMACGDWLMGTSGEMLLAL